MDRIRVNTEELRQKSKEFESSAEAYAQVGKDILSFVGGLPSYDGQLSTPARAAALEINRQCQDLHGSYTNISQSLARTAQAFEEADNQAVDTFTINQLEISKTPMGLYFSRRGSAPRSPETQGRFTNAEGGGPGGETAPFHDYNADINGAIAGTMTFLPDGACKVEDNGEAPQNGWAALASALDIIVDWVDKFTGSKKTREKVIGEKIDFYIEYSRDSKGNGGFNMNGVTVRNNSSETIRIDYVSIDVNGTKYETEVVGAPIFIHPGEVVNIQINQDKPIYPYFLGATVTLRGARPDSCNPNLQDLITLTIPPINLPTDVVRP